VSSVSLKVNTIQTATGGNMFTGGAGSIVKTQPVIVKSQITRATNDVEAFVFYWTFNKLNSAASSKLVCHGVRLGRNTVSGIQGEYVQCQTSGATTRYHNIDGAYQTSTYPNVVNFLGEWTTLAAGSHIFRFGYRVRTGNQYPLTTYNAMRGQNDARGANQATSFIMYEVLV